MMGTTVVCTNTQKRWSTSKENKTTKDPRPDGRGHGWLGYKDSNLNCLIQSQMYYPYTIPQRGQVVPMKRFELLRGHPHYALNVARLPVPPHRRSHLLPPLLYTKRARFVKSNLSLLGQPNPSECGVQRRVTTENASGMCESYTPCGFKLQPGFCGSAAPCTCNASKREKSQRRTAPGLGSNLPLLNMNPMLSQGIANSTVQPWSTSRLSLIVPCTSTAHCRPGRS